MKFWSGFWGEWWCFLNSQTAKTVLTCLRLFQKIYRRIFYKRFLSHVQSPRD